MRNFENRISGLYAIADTGTVGDDRLVELAEQVLAGGCRVLQYRDKSSHEEKRLLQATQLQNMCELAGALFIINDDAELANKLNADGVHCGREDASVRETKAKYPNLLIGASCYNSLNLAQKAVSDGADYLAFGCFFASKTKPLAASADLATLQQARKIFKLPIVAIGGIVAENAEILISSGASAVAVISGVFLSPNPLASSRKFSELFNKQV